MKVKHARILTLTILIIGFIIIMLGSYLYEPLLIVGAIVTVSSLIPHFLYNKCPHCGRHLGRNRGRFCQYCRKEVE